MGKKIGLAGDWHGNGRWARYVLDRFVEEGVHDVYQLGDFGIWPGGRGRAYINEVHTTCAVHDTMLYVTLGNHEDYSQVAALHADDSGLMRISDRIYVFPRGYRWKMHGRTFVSLGGAPSVDFPHRTEGVNWWPEEAITLEEAERTAAGGPADVMLAHDSPDGGSNAVQRIVNQPAHQTSWTDRALRYAREGRKMMNIAFQGVRPKVFAHGHYHIYDATERDGCKFLSLSADGFVGNAAVLDLDTLEHEWVDLR